MSSSAAAKCRGLFITGTDTEVGKTHVSVLLIKAMVRRGLRVAALKPIASGFEQIDGAWQNVDVNALTQAANVKLPSGRINRYGFGSPIAPHIAAQQDSIQIDLQKISEDVDFATEHAECVIVEGVGGWHVPLSSAPRVAEDIESLAKVLSLPVVMVVGLRLGCLNHAILTARVIQSSGLDLLGWVANHLDEQFSFQHENVSTLEQLLPCPKLFEVPFAKCTSGLVNAQDMQSVYIDHLCKRLKNY